MDYRHHGKQATMQRVCKRQEKHIKPKLNVDDLIFWDLETSSFPDEKENVNDVEQLNILLMLVVYNKTRIL